MFIKVDGTFRNLLSSLTLSTCISEEPFLSFSCLETIGGTALVAAQGHYLVRDWFPGVGNYLYTTSEQSHHAASN